MSSLHIINHPTSVLTYLAPEGGVYDGEEFGELKKRMYALGSPRNRVMCHVLDVCRLEIFPDVMVEAGPGLIKHARIRERMAKNPLLAAQMLLASYDETQPMLERTVLASGEASVPLLCAIDEGRIKPSAGREAYEATLLNQPWWGMRYLSTPCAGAEVTALRSAFASKLLSACAERHQANPQAALVHLYLNAEIDPAPHAELLCRDPMVAYLASRLLCPRGLNLNVEQVAGLDARWATHIALWGGFDGGNVNQAVEDAITAHAAWTGEYIARNEAKHKDWNWVKGLYDKMESSFKTRGSGEPDLWTDLLWAMLDRICLQIEGKEPHLTLAQSYGRHAPPPPAQKAVSVVTAASAADSAFADSQN